MTSLRRPLAAAALVVLIASGAQPPPDRPNIVLVITDDLGWGDLGSYGSTDIRTPRLDDLARHGVRMTQFYSNAVFCSPTRAGLMTGRYQQRYGIERPYAHASVDSAEGLPADGRSLPQRMKDAGYATALIGKWHLGYTPERSPLAHGFDEFFGLKAGYHDYWTHRDRGGDLDLWENDDTVQVAGYTTDLLAERAVSFIDRNTDRPFFLEVAFNAPHWPYQRPDDIVPARDGGRHLQPADSATSVRGDYVAMVERMDEAFGRIMDALDRHGLAGNTLVVFTNDNGGEWLADNGPFAGRKWMVYEGGIRVPAILRWPDRLPAGMTSGQVGITMDLSATALAASGASLDGMEGVDLVPLLGGNEPERSRTLFWHTSEGGFRQSAVRDGDYKLVVDGVHQFVYDLAADPGERRDLARTHQDVARRLKGLLDAWQADVNAEAAGRAGSR